MRLRKLTRREMILGAVTGTAAGVLGYGALSKFAVETSFRTLSLFPRSGKSLRIAHVSDLHADETPLWVIASAIDIVRRAAPDIIALTGDYVSATLTFQQEYLEALSRLARIAPTFAVMGNHDGGAWAYRAGGYRESGLVRRFVEKAGIQVLHNRQVEIQVGDRQLQLIGLGDLWSGEFEPEYAFQSGRQDQPTVVLSHNPDSKSWIKSWHWNLMLSGHTHGGQLIVPLTGETPFAPVRDRRYVHGLKAWVDRYIQVSRGVGTVHGFRFNCPPEVAILDLV